MRRSARDSGPPRDDDHDVAGWKHSAWSQRAAAKIAELQSQLNRIEKIGLAEPDIAIAEKTRSHLRAARDAVSRRSGMWARMAGYTTDRAFANIHRAEVQLLHLTPEEDLRWRGAVVLAQARQHLGAADPRLQILEARLASTKNELHPTLRDLAVTTLLAAHDAEETETARVRSFRNILAASVLVTSVIAVLLLVWAYVSPTALPPNLCAADRCPVKSAPSGSDVALVEFVGLGAAALAGAVSLRSIQGTATPYSVPMMLVLLRLPVGALSALFGVLLINGEFIPGLTQLDSGSQIVAWAIAFGIFQEGVTRMVDRQGDAVLTNARGSERGFRT
ncbi:hypothetical protein [Streptomyces litchfieldiae]|uniref:Integral membrane protein n=1 Tax=Streptomyces litchfieldiae TaxID=3075543 RepID=A0ABU2MIU1_9ACTN|nr:hypothetical protein [Streptomyces sp. DSM 44938]MDT0341512.1 hypothetical protein [Streptomyces sp. DSM 44938]